MSRQIAIVTKEWYVAGKAPSYLELVFLFASSMGRKRITKYLGKLKLYIAGTVSKGGEEICWAEAAPGCSTGGSNYVGCRIESRM